MYVLQPPKSEKKTLLECLLAWNPNSIITKDSKTTKMCVTNTTTRTSKEVKTNYEYYDIVIVGAGVAGASAAYHLQKACAGTTNNPRILIVEAGPAAGVGIAPRNSGTATMNAAGSIKMMVQIFAGGCGDFVRHHGEEGAQRYLRATQEGLLLQKKVAQEMWDTSTDDHMKELGSYYVGYAQDRNELKREFDLLRSWKCCEDIEWCDSPERLASVPGWAEDTFDCAIYFPRDAVIDSSLYTQCLLQHVLDNGIGNFNGRPAVTFWPNTKVKQVIDGDSQRFAQLELQSGKIITARHVVMATGGLNPIPQLEGILKPCYSYLVHVPVSQSNRDSSNDIVDSPNFFTWGFSHDWCFTRGKVRCSGEDHFSALKPPHCQERCHNLTNWTLQVYNNKHQGDEEEEKKEPEEELFDTTSVPQQYGIYSETPDMAPLVGHLRPNSRVCYLVGCNAWGQTILSYCSSLIPGLLEYTKLEETQRDALRLVSVRRFTQLSAYSK